jgi:hypothetical protein
MTPSAAELPLRVNGIQPAFCIEFGLASPRADEGRSTHAIRDACQESNVAPMFAWLSTA